MSITGTRTFAMTAVPSGPAGDDVVRVTVRPARVRRGGRFPRLTARRGRTGGAWRHSGRPRPARVVVVERQRGAVAGEADPTDLAQTRGESVGKSTDLVVEAVDFGPAARRVSAARDRAEQARLVLAKAMVEAAHRGLRPVEIGRQTGYTKERDGFYHGCRRDVIELAGSYAPATRSGTLTAHLARPSRTVSPGVTAVTGESDQQIANK